MTAPPLIPRSDLPAGWKWTKLSDAISYLQLGFACGERDTTGVVQVRMHNVSTAGSFNWGELIRVPSSYTDMSKYWVEPGDVLFNNTNSVELVGKSAIFSGFTEPIVFSNHFSRLRTDPGALEADFLAKWLVLSWQQGLFASICNRWVGQAAVDRQKLLELTIPSHLSPNKNASWASSTSNSPLWSAPRGPRRSALRQRERCEELA